MGFYVYIGHMLLNYVCFWLFDRLVYMLRGVELESARVYFREDLACLFAAESGIDGDERLASAIAAAEVLGYL